MTLEAQHENAQRLEEEAPYNAKCVRFAKQIGLTLTGQDGNDLQNCDQVNDSIRCPIAAMRFLKPRMQYSVLGNAVHHSVGTDDGRIHCSRKNKHADDHDKNMKCESQQLGPGKMHR